MNDLYALDMSQILAKAVNSRMLEPEASPDGWISHVLICAAHMTLSLPKCLMCIEAERAQVHAVA